MESEQKATLYFSETINMETNTYDSNLCEESDCCHVDNRCENRNHVNGTDDVEANSDTIESAEDLNVSAGYETWFLPDHIDDVESYFKLIAVVMYTLFKDNKQDRY